MTIVLSFEDLESAKTLANALNLAVNKLYQGNVKEQEASGVLSILLNDFQDEIDNVEEFIENELKLQGKVKRNAKRN